MARPTNPNQNTPVQAQAGTTQTQSAADKIAELQQRAQPDFQEMGQDDIVRQLAEQNFKEQFNRQLDRRFEEMKAMDFYSEISREQFEELVAAEMEGDSASAEKIRHDVMKASMEKKQANRDDELDGKHTEGPGDGGTDRDEPPASLDEGIDRAIARFRGKTS